MVSSLRKEVFFCEHESKKENESEETRILAKRKKDEEIKELREKLSNHLNNQRVKDEGMLELIEKMASLNFQLEQAKTRLKNESTSKIRDTTESVQIEHTPEKPVSRETSSVLPRKIPEEQNFYPKWTSFEFVTKKIGAEGPTKSECIGYYSEK